MADLIANLAVIGRIQLIPGILPVQFDAPRVDCLVVHSFHNKMEDPDHGIEIDTSDCTLFTITHKDQGEPGLPSVPKMQKIFERSVAAISEVVIWTKAHEKTGKVSPYSRQIGIVDVKAFFVLCEDKQLVGWLNPAFKMHRDAAAMMSGFLSNMIVSNGPSTNPVSSISCRVMSSLDLINLGFYTESFVNIFSLVDDLTQETVKSGLIKKGLDETQQKDLLRAIKEERLKIYLCNLAKLCDWQSLEEADKELFNKVMKVNALRNKIMHGSRRLTRNESIDASNSLLGLIDWLRGNPFGYAIPQFPLLRLAIPEFTIIPLKEKPGQSDSPASENEA